MTDLTKVLATRARTGRFHGQNAADEQAYFEAFSGAPVPRAPLSLPISTVVRAMPGVLGRLLPGRARLT